MKKVIKLVVFVLLIGLFSPIKGLAAGFNDITAGYIFFEEVEYLSSEQMITGFKDGTFKADHVVTRAQAAIMIGRALDLNGDPKNTKFKDVMANVTGSGYIASAVEKGIITGFPDNTYRPNEPVTRGQMAIFLNRAFTLEKGQSNRFKDVSPNMAACQSILNVTATGIANGYPDRTYRPDTSVTRGQFSAFMARTLNPVFRERGRIVISVDKNHFLVVDSYPHHSPAGIFYSAISFEYPNASEILKIGQRVEVESAGPINQSYPAQAVAKKVKILPDYKPEGATLSESEVLRKAIEIAEQKSNWVPGFRYINFDKNHKVWNIGILQNGKTYELKIEDK